MFSSLCKVVFCIIIATFKVAHILKICLAHIFKNKSNINGMLFVGCMDDSTASEYCDTVN